MDKTEFEIQSFSYDDVNADIYSYYRTSMQSHGDRFLAIVEASNFFMEDEDFIESIINEFEGEDYA